MLLKNSIFDNINILSLLNFKIVIKKNINPNFKAQKGGWKSRCKEHSSCPMY